LCVCVLSWGKGGHEQQKKVRERQKGRAAWGAIGRGESLIVQPLQTTNGSRSLLPSPWTFDCSKSLLDSSRFFDFFNKNLLLLFLLLFFLLVFFPYLENMFLQGFQIFLLLFLFSLFFPYFFFFNKF
jgi:hypothetical protein